MKTIIKIQNSFIFLSLILHISCVSVTEDKKKIKQDDYDINILDCKCSKIENKKDLAVIFFESNFNNDVIELSINGNIIKEQITTDDRLGLAKFIELGKLSDIKDISFRINKGKRVILNNKCNFIFVNYLKNSIVEVDFSDKFTPYR